MGDSKKLKVHNLICEYWSSLLLKSSLDPLPVERFIFELCYFSVLLPRGLLRQQGITGNKERVSILPIMLLLLSTSFLVFDF